MRDQRKLEVAACARELAVAVYRFTSGFPSRERFGLVEQMRRAAVSVGSNIAEGAGRYGDREFLRYIHIAYASASELAFQLGVAAELGFGPAEEHELVMQRIDRVQRMLNRLSQRIKSGQRVRSESQVK